MQASAGRRTISIHEKSNIQYPIPGHDDRNNLPKPTIGVENRQGARKTLRRKRGGREKKRKEGTRKDMKAEPKSQVLDFETVREKKCINPNRFVTKMKRKRKTDSSLQKLDRIKRKEAFAIIKTNQGQPHKKPFPMSC